MRSKDIKNEIRKRITKDQLGIFKTEIYKDMHKEINYFLGEIFDDNMKIFDIDIEHEFDENSELSHLYTYSRGAFICKAKIVFTKMYLL